MLRQIQTIRLGHLQLRPDTQRTVMPQAHMELNERLLRLDLAPIFARPPNR